MKSQIRQQAEETADMKKELEHLQIEKKAKLKFLASSLLFSQMESYATKTSKLHNAWQIWTNQILCNKVAESAFNKVMELTQKHSAARNRAGACLLVRYVEHFKMGLKSDGFRAIKHTGMTSNKAS